MKPPKFYTATVFRQAPAVNEQAQFTYVDIVRGTHEQCWEQAKELVKFPVLEFSNENQMPH